MPAAAPAAAAAARVRAVIGVGDLRRLARRVASLHWAAMVDIPLRGKVRDPQRHAFAVRASKWFVAGLIGCSFVIGLAGTRDPIEVLAVTGFLSVTLCVLPILFAWYMLGEYSHPLTTVYILRASADDLVLHDAGGAAVGSLRAGQIQVSRTNAEVWRNAGTKYAQSNLSAVVQVRSPGGTFFIFPDATVAPNADCATTPMTTCYELPQAAYFQVARLAADPPRV